MERPQAQIKHYSIEYPGGAKVVLSNLGAGIVSIVVPDKNGSLDNVALSYMHKEDWMADGPCMGKIPGRFANRIALGKFSLEGSEYTMAVNNGPNHLHGGPDAQSFANRIWDAEPFEGGVKFTLHSADGDAGYPGAMDIEAVYRFRSDNVLTLDIKAVSDKATVVNLTNHVYFNLRGERRYGGDGIRSHTLKLYASHYLPTDATQIPTGEIAPVAGTPMDFTAPKAIGRDLNADFEALKIGKGYDHCWCIDDYDATLRPAAELSASGRKVTVYTDQPGIQVYTGNWLKGSPVAPTGYNYCDYDGVALECQAFPDAPNKPQFPSATLKPGSEYRNRIMWKFTAE